MVGGKELQGKIGGGKKWHEEAVNDVRRQGRQEEMRCGVRWREGCQGLSGVSGERKRWRTSE